MTTQLIMGISRTPREKGEGEIQVSVSPEENAENLLQIRTHYIIANTKVIQCTLKQTFMVTN